MKPHKSLVLLAVLFTSSSSIFVRLSAMPAFVISFYRMTASALLMLIPVLIGNKGKLEKISRKDMVLCLFSGVALALHFATWIASISMTTVAASTVLVSCSPMFVALINMLFFKKKPGKVFLICLAGAFAGTVAIAIDGAGPGSLGSARGNLLALAGALFVAVYLLIGAEVRKRVSTSMYAFTVYGISAVILFVSCIVFSQPLSPSVYETKDFIIVALMALVCSVGGHTMYNMLLKFHGAVVISLASLCEPVFASLLAALILSEVPSVVTVLGGVIILVSLAMYLYISDKNKKTSANG